MKREVIDLVKLVKKVELEQKLLKNKGTYKQDTSLISLSSTSSRE